MMENTDKFKIRLKELRKEKNMRQEDLAKRLGVVRSAIANYETGRTIPDSETLSIIANILDTTTDYLLGRTDNPAPYNNDNDENSVIKKFEEKHQEVHDVEEAMEIILAQPGLMLKGELLSDESKIILANAIQMGLRTAEEIERKKKNTNKGDNNE